jgi:uncharacterized protein YjiS (DUF1127 family)
MRAMALRAAQRCPDQVPPRTRPASRARLSGAIGGVMAALGEWQRRRRSRAQLATLDERMLQDIGLSRADAWFEINKPFWRE